MIIREATIKDIDQIELIYNRIHDQEEAGRVTTGWIRGVYPVRSTAEQALKRRDLFVMEEAGNVIAAAIINQEQVPDYRNALWQYEAEEDRIMVLHTLVVDPLQGKKGYGRAFVDYYEQLARDYNCFELRMDTNAVNKRARQMYHKLGYEEIDIIPCVFNGIPGVQLVCLEKKLD